MPLANRLQPIYRKVGRNIARARRAAGLSQSDLGVRLDPAQIHSSVANIEHGKQRVQLHTLLQMGRILGIDWRDLIEERQA